jgi:hypothetical protein
MGPFGLQFCLYLGKQFRKDRGMHILGYLANTSVKTPTQDSLN